MSNEFETKPAFTVVSTPLWENARNQATQAAELQDKLLRTVADWDNYRKRAQREKEESVKYAAEGMLEKLLPVIDNFELGLQAAQKDSSPVAQGLNMVFNQLQQFLRDIGVEVIDAVGQPFDPHRHEALGHMPSADVPEGTVVSQMRKGYKVKDRLLRPASVFVAQSPQAETVSS